MLTIPEYFADKTLFITGGTGFIGKVLVEKLLRSCPQIKAIYCLIRSKKGQDPKARLETMFEERMYSRLRLDQPDFMDKVHPIHGDVSEDRLGISDTEYEFLTKNVQIVFHSAATVRFDEPLRLALEMNVLGVRKMVHLCKAMKNLEVFVHVSTAYANCEHQYIEEVVYPSLDPQKLIDAVAWMDDEMVALITPKLIGTKPNTYTYTKHLAETLLMREATGLPLAIVRPSIVTAAWREPIPGWIDNFNGPSGLYIAAGKGLMRSLKCDSRMVADMIPVDLPVNMLISVAWATAVHKLEPNLIYHITTGTLNPMTWGQMEDHVTKFFKRIPMEDCVRRPKCHLRTNSLVHDYWILVSHLIPAYMMDLGYRLAGQKPRMVRIYNKLHRAMGILEYFTMRSWEWTHKNMDMLRSHMTQADQKDFYFDPRLLHWPTYIENYCLGTKTFILKEDPSGLPAARAHIKKLRNIRYTCNTLILILLWRVLIARSNLARNSWYFVLGLVSKFVRFFRILSSS